MIPKIIEVVITQRSGDYKAQFPDIEIWEVGTTPTRALLTLAARYPERFPEPLNQTRIQFIPFL